MLQAKTIRRPPDRFLKEEKFDPEKTERQIEDLVKQTNNVSSGKENVASKDTDVALSANSDIKYPSQKAVKTYVDTKTLALLSTINVPLNSNGQTTIYTVPAGKRCVLHSALLVIDADAGTSDLSIGQKGATTDFLPVQNLDNLDAQYDVGLLMPVPSATPALPQKSYAGGTIIEADVSNQAGGVTNKLFLFGVLY